MVSYLNCYVTNNPLKGCLGQGKGLISWAGVVGSVVSIASPPGFSGSCFLTQHHCIHGHPFQICLWTVSTTKIGYPVVSSVAFERGDPIGRVSSVLQTRVYL